jgi:hypothetical protein
MTCNVWKCNSVEISKVDDGPSFKENNDYDL